MTARPTQSLNEVFAERLRTRRIELGLTQEELAEKERVTVGYISLLERGGRSPPLERIESLATSLEVDPLYLLGMA